MSAIGRFALSAIVIGGAVAEVAAIIAITPPNPAPTRTAVTIDDIKARSEYISYIDLAREPGRYKGKVVIFRNAKVIQVMESGRQVMESGRDLQLRVNVTRGQYEIWTGTLFVDYLRPANVTARILEGDIINVWGEYRGIMSYKAVLGHTISIPHVSAAVIE